MSLKVIGAGFGRTGTLSLKGALERLGFGTCYHMVEVFGNPKHMPIWTEAQQGNPVDWDALFEGYQSSVDWPSCNFWREQLEHFPDAKVILTKRDPEKWYTSIMNTIYNKSLTGSEFANEKSRMFRAWVDDIIWNPVFDDRLDDRAHVIDVFNRHNQSVIDSVAPEKLLVYTPGDGWGPLCAFLGVALPDEEYPHVNTTKEFVAGHITKKIGTD